MSDTTLREHERLAATGDPEAAAAYLNAQIRAGLRVPAGALAEGRWCRLCKSRGTILGVGWVGRIVGMEPRVTCPRCKGESSHGPCHTRHWENDARIEDVATLLAYCGDEAAREVLGQPGPERTWRRPDYFPPERWAAGFLALAARLPGVVVEVPCHVCEGTGDHAHKLRDGKNMKGWAYVGPRECTCTDGKRTITVEAERYLAAWLGVVVGRACLVCWQCEACNERDHSLEYLESAEDFDSRGIGISYFEDLESDFTCTCDNARRDLDAARDWLVCPCPSRREACRGTIVPEPQWAWAFVDGIMGPFYDGSTLKLVLAAAEKVIGPDGLRAAVGTFRKEVWPA